MVRIDQAEFQDYRSWLANIYRAPAIDMDGDAYRITQHFWFAFGGVADFDYDEQSGASTLKVIFR